ncbi:MAG TPA: YciI family protein [Steroidobacteraceae bacterium]|nr:YciI family protein [Steroidobacteraceae bacterium]
MFYCILCYNLESELEAWPREKEAAVLAQREVVAQHLAAQGRLGPVARLMPTTTAMTMRASREPVVLDGPFAETKEQLLGFYMVDCRTLEEAIAVARNLVGDTGALEVRPVATFYPGVGLQ